MRHLLVHKQLEPGSSVPLTGSDAHYLLHVLRLKPGDAFDVLDATGAVFVAYLEHASDADVRAVARSVKATGPDRPWTITLFQALPKGRKLDDIIRAAVQAGADRIVPLITHHTVNRPAHDHGRLERWQRVAREAVQQSGGSRPVVIDEVAGLESVRATADASLFLHPEPLAHGSLHGYLDEVPRSLELVVGPEGGFSRSEVRTLVDRGFYHLYLGPRVLRTETAAVFALGAVQILLQERQQWQLRNGTAL